MEDDKKSSAHRVVSALIAVAQCANLKYLYKPNSFYLFYNRGLSTKNDKKHMLFEHTAVSNYEYQRF